MEYGSNSPICGICVASSSTSLGATSTIANLLIKATQNIMNQGGYGGGSGHPSSHGYGADDQQQLHYGDDQQGYYGAGSSASAYNGAEAEETQFQDDAAHYEEYQQQQQQYNEDQQYEQYGEEYSDDLRHHEEQHHLHDPNAPFWRKNDPFVAHPLDTPDNYGQYNTAGDPISAIAIDDNEDNASLMFLASHTSVQREKRQGAQHNIGQARRSRSKKDLSLDRGSRLTVFYHDEEQATYGDKSMYSSFVGHPEASPHILNGLHSVLFNGGRDIVAKNSTLSGLSTNAASKARPSHAYGPPYGPAVHTHLSSTNLFNAIHHSSDSSARPEDKCCMGISSIFSVSTPFLGTGGRICSISPNGVRVHTRGGMVMCSREGLLRGMTCGELLPGANFATVAGMTFSDEDSTNKRSQHVHCVDLERDLKIASSHTLVRDNATITSSGEEGGGGLMCVTDMAMNPSTNNVVVGCSDGTVRVLDGGRRNAEVAKAKAHTGGVAKVAIMENLICASGYTSAGVSSPSSPLPYPHPDPHVLIYDVRYLGRGGMPHSTFSYAGMPTMRPRFVDFLPDGNLLVGSGQTFGSFEIITPFETTSSKDPMLFQPELNAGESMSTVEFHDGELYIGTSYGRLLQYELANYEKTKHSTTSSAVSEPLDMPPFVPSPPDLSIDPSILCTDQSSSQSIQGHDLFNGYILTSNPLISSDRSVLHPRYSRASVRATTLGPISKRAMVAPSKRWLSKMLQSELDATMRGSFGNNQISKVFPTESVELDDLLATTVSSTDDENVTRTGYRRVHKQKATNNSNKNMTTFLNPNKLIYSRTPFETCYDATVNPRRGVQTQTSEEDGQEEETDIPRRYRLMLRPPFYKVANFDYTQYNDSGVFVGWDYAVNFANSFACSVLTLLYFVEEIRTSALQLQLCNKEMAIQEGVSVTVELGLLFNLIESLSANGLIRPSDNKSVRGQVKAFVPSGFLSAFALLPEARNLALIDGVPGAAEIARRPEAFYRFIMQYIEREVGQLLSLPLPSEVTSQGQFIDKLQGINSISVIEYVNGKPKISTSRSLTVDMSYDGRQGGKALRFGEILRFSLCKASPLRAWCDETRSYEAVLNHKIAISLPSLLSLSCCCAGQRAGSEGLQFWQQENSRNWLAEFIQVQIEIDKSITVKELSINDDGQEEWITSAQPLSLPPSFFDSWETVLPQNLPIKKSYQLDGVVSFVRSSDTTQNEGHHVVHVRTPVDFEVQSLVKQLQQVEKCLTEKAQASTETDEPITLVAGISLQERAQYLEEEIQKLNARQNDKEAHDQWLLINGFVVTKVEPDDVRSFNAKFKEPSIVLFREITDQDGGQCAVTVKPSKELSVALNQNPLVPANAMSTLSISTGLESKLTFSKLPRKGDLVAIDAEFVCVQQEESLISSSGSKEMISEARNALARLSIICDNEVIIDDYVLPNEPIVDYLTRFSGIRPSDLDASSSPHHLVTPQEAYLKVRLLLERGCIFVGHGLTQDFRVIGICIPSNQVIDTAEIYHQPNQRFISLRYLTNYALKQDMQQEVHDSIEDANAALALYNKALELKKVGKLDEYIAQLYAHGQSTQFSITVAHEKTVP